MTSHDPRTARLEARSDEVHVWRVGLDVPTEEIGARRALLSDDERVRMDRFVFDVHRRRYCVGRAMLRRLLGSYLGVRPESVALAYGEQGKPRLVRVGESSADVRLNVSHSADEALIAVSLGRELGVDIERIKADIDFEKIAQRFFSRDEFLRLLGVADERRPAAFFECWTRKESFIKACGGGLRLPLDGFDVAFGPGVRAELLRVKWDADEAERWTMAALEVAEGFRGAITVQGRGWELRQLDAGDLKVI